MRIAYCVSKAIYTHTHTNTICNTYCFSTAKMVERKGLNITLNLHCLSCFISLRRADRSSREVLPNVVCLIEIVKQRQWWGPAPLGALASWKIKRLNHPVLIMERQCLYSRPQRDSVINYVGRDSSAGIETRYELDVPGIESSWWNPCGQALQPIQPPTKWLQVLFSPGKAAGAWRWSPIPSSAEVKERVQLYLFSPSGP
jgi:hypothetical protein